MLVAGLTGGMACGKTHVAGYLHDLGCHVIEADEIGREVMSPGAEAYEKVIDEFGPDVLSETGEIDRLRLAAQVFGTPGDLARLNAIVHPAVRERALRMTSGFGNKEPHAIVIYVAAILIESGAVKDVEKVIVVTCTREQQVERAMKRSGSSRAEVIARLNSQMPLEKKLEFADYVIDASSTSEDTLRQTKMVYEELRKLA